MLQKTVVAVIHTNQLDLLGSFLEGFFHVTLHHQVVTKAYSFKPLIYTGLKKRSDKVLEDPPSSSYLDKLRGGKCEEEIRAAFNAVLSSECGSYWCTPYYSTHVFHIETKS